MEQDTLVTADSVRQGGLLTRTVKTAETTKKHQQHPGATKNTATTKTTNNNNNNNNVYYTTATTATLIHFFLYNEVNTLLITIKKIKRRINETIYFNYMANQIK
jgi:hypothetical protein